MPPPVRVPPPQDAAGPRGGSSDDEDGDALAYEAELEEALEDSYVQYLDRKGHRDAVQMVGGWGAAGEGLDH